MAALSDAIASGAAAMEGLIAGARQFSISEWRLLGGVLAALADTEALPNNWWQEDQEAPSALSQLFAEAAERQKEHDALWAGIQGEVAGTLDEIESLFAPIRGRFNAWDPFIQSSYWQAVAEALESNDLLPARWWQQSEDALKELYHIFLSAAEHCKEQRSLSQEISPVIGGTARERAVLLAPVSDRFGRWHDHIRPSYWHWRRRVQSELRPRVQFQQLHIESLK